MHLNISIAELLFQLNCVYVINIFNQTKCKACIKIVLSVYFLHVIQIYEGYLNLR